MGGKGRGGECVVAGCRAAVRLLGHLLRRCVSFFDPLTNAFVRKQHLYVGGKPIQKQGEHRNLQLCGVCEGRQGREGYVLQRAGGRADARRPGASCNTLPA